MADEVLDNNTEVQTPQQPTKDYVDNVYNALKAKVGGFDVSPDEFRKSISTDNNYRDNVYKALKAKVSGFDATPDDFYGAIGVKKKEPTHEAIQYGQDATDLSKIVGKQNTSQSQSTSTSKPSLKSYLQGEQQPLPTTSQVDENKPQGVTPTASNVDLEKAINDATTKAQKNLGAFGHIGKTKEEITQAYKNGDLVLNDKGNLVRGTGIWESLYNGIENANKSELENNYVASLSKNDAISHLNAKIQHPEIMGGQQEETAPSGTAAKVAQYVGENTPMLAKGIVGSILGAGTELTGGASAGSFLAIANDIAKSGYSGTLENNYRALKAQNPNISDEEAYDKANKAALASEVLNLGAGAIMTASFKPKTPEPSVPINGVLDGILHSVGHAVKSAPRVLGSVAASAAGEEAANKLTGVDVNLEDALSHVSDKVKGMAIMHFGIPVIAGLASVPSYLKPQLENAVASAPRQETLQFIRDQEQNGNLPEGSAEKVMSKLSEFDQQKAVVAPLRVSEETKAAITGKLLQKQKLIESLYNLPEDSLPSAKADIESQITDINKQIDKMYKSKNVYEHETDSLTGDKAIQPKNDETAQVQQPTEATKPIEEEINKPIGETKEAEPTGEEKIAELNDMAKHDPDDFALNYFDEKENKEYEKIKDTSEGDAMIEAKRQIEEDKIKSETKPIKQPTVSDVELLGTIQNEFGDKYNKINLPNGKTLSLRIADHSGNPHWIDSDRNISIVISDNAPKKMRYPNEFYFSSKNTAKEISDFINNKINEIKKEETPDKWDDRYDVLKNINNKYVISDNAEIEDIDKEFDTKKEAQDYAKSLFEQKTITPKTEQDVQEQSTGSLLQHPQEGIGETGSERGRMEQSEQGEETTKKSSENGNGEKPIGEVNEGEYTSLKKRIYDTERDAEGKPIVDTSTGKSAVERANETKAKIESGEISQQEIDDIQSAIANGTDINTKLKPEEIEHVLLYNKNKLAKEGRELNKQYNEIPQSDHEAVMNKGFELVRNQELKDENYKATKNLNAEWGRQGQAIQLSIDNDYSFEHLKDRIEQHLDDKNIPEPIKEKLKILSDKIGDLQDKLDNHTKKLQEHEEALKKSEEEKLKLEEENSKLKAEQALEDKKDEVRRGRIDKKADLAKQKQATLDQIKARYNRLRGSANSGLNFNLLELAPDIAKLAKIHVEEGIVNIEELIDKMHDELKDVIEGITKRQIRDLFSGYGKLQKLSDDPVDIELSKLRAHGKALSGLEDVTEKNQAPLRSGTTHREPTEEVRMLRKRINDEMRKRGIDIRKAKDPEKVWKTALESFKTRTENRIKYLENIKKISDIERYKQEQQRVKLKLDKEGNDLKAKAQIEKNRVDGLIRQYEFEKWNKFDKAMHYVNRLSKGIMISNPAILVKILGSVIWRGAAKIPSTFINLGVSKLLSPISKLEGINSVNDAVAHIGTYYSTLFSKENWKGIKDAFKNKSNNEDLLYGKKYFKETIPEPNFSTNWGNPVKALGDVSKASFFWTLRALERNAAAHGAEKSAASKPEFEAYKQTINRNFQNYKNEISGQLIKEGLLPKEYSNENVQELVNQLAFQKSLRAKFMQENKVSGVQKVVEGHFRNTGNIGIAEGINTLLPITKIGSNFTGEALEQHPIIGAIPQLRNIFNYAINGESALTTKQKGNVVRALTNQGVGVACYLIGAYAYKSINPFYQSSAKKYADRNGKELPEDKNDIGIIPEIWAHSPYALNIRAGASNAWVWDKYDEANPDESVMSKFFNTTLDAFQENLRAEMASSPYISTGESTIAPLVGSGDFGKAAANFIKGRIPFSTTIGELSQGKVPVLNKVAPELSKKVGEVVGLKEETVKPTDVDLKPKGFMQNMGIGFPAWRENVIKEMYDEKYNKEKQRPDVEKKIDARERKFDKKDKTEIFKQEHNLQ